MVALSPFYALSSVLGALATPLIFDGRAPFNYTETDLNNSIDPYLT
jgi:dTDP-4-dehydrorhamnose reductase